MRATPVDGNVERVVARLFALPLPLPKAKPELRRLAETLTPAKRAGDHAQAMMDLGATVCTPRRPSCLVCPLADFCAARASGIAAQLPMREAKPERPTRLVLAYVAIRADGCVLLRRRPENGLLGGMLEVPSTEWADPLPRIEDNSGPCRCGATGTWCRGSSRTRSPTSGSMRWSTARWCPPASA